MTSCSSAHEQFVHKTLCPRLLLSSSSLSSSTTERSSDTRNAGTTPGLSTSAVMASNPAEAASNTTGSNTSSKNSVSTGLLCDRPESGYTAMCHGLSNIVLARRIPGDSITRFYRDGNGANPFLSLGRKDSRGFYPERHRSS